VESVNIELKKVDEFVVYSFVFFNAFLCLLVGVGLNITPFIVMLIQVVLTAYIMVRVFLSDKVGVFEYLFFGIITFFLIITFVFKNYANLKMLFDAYSVLIFILFGRVSSANFPDIGYKVLKIILLVSIIEVLLPSLYLKMLPVGQYYYKTRTWVQSQDIDVGGLTYYIGAVRPGENYLSFIDHRLGSLFLESLSLGYFLSLAFVIWLLKKDELSKLGASLCFIGIALACLLTDMRTANMMFLLAVVVFVYRRFFLALSPIYYVIGIISVFFLAFQISDSSSELNYRLSLTFAVLQNNSPASLLGFGSLVGNFNDSGYLYLISIYGIIPLILTFAYLGYYYTTTPAQFVKYTLLLTLMIFTIAMFFGFAFLSAKISVLWLGLIGNLYEKSLKERGMG
jgi:putative polymerase